MDSRDFSHYLAIAEELGLKLDKIQEICLHPDVDDFEWLKNRILEVIDE